MLATPVILSSIAAVRSALRPFLGELDRTLAATERHVRTRGADYHPPGIPPGIIRDYLSELMKDLHVPLETLLQEIDRLRQAVGAGTLYETCGMGVTADWVEMARMWLYRIGVEDDL